MNEAPLLTLGREVARILMDPEAELDRDALCDRMAALGVARLRPADREGDPEDYDFVWEEIDWTPPAGYDPVALLARLVAILDRKYEPKSWEGPDNVSRPEIGGGDCARHGRWYGICHSCQREEAVFYEDQAWAFDCTRAQDLRRLLDDVKKWNPTL